MGILIFRFFIIAVHRGRGLFFSGLRAAAAGRRRRWPSRPGAVIMYLETTIRKTQFKIIWGSTIGTFAGVFLGWSLGAVYQTITRTTATGMFIRIFFLIIMPYIGFLVGTQKSEWLDPAHLFRFFREKSVGRSYKILDTSVIIDGRITDLCDTGFIEGTLVIPQFVLKELQLVADSPGRIQAAAGPARAGHPQPSPEVLPDLGRHHGDGFPRDPGRRLQAHRAGQAARRQDRHQRRQPEQGGPAAAASPSSTSTSWPTP